MSNNLNVPVLNFTGERFIPDLNLTTAFRYEHFARYLFAKEIVSKKIVLDIGCGSGYGSFLLAIMGGADKVFGIDISREAIEYARSRYRHKDIDFRVDDAEILKTVQTNVDVVVDFELFEHLHNPEKHLLRIKEVLKKDGVLVISTPNNVTYPKGNEFHITEYSYDEFHSFLSKYFKKVIINSQSYKLGQIIETPSAEVDLFGEKYKKYESNHQVFVAGNDVNNAEYFVAVCSDAKLPECKSTSFILNKVDSFTFDQGLSSLSKVISSQHSEIIQLQNELSRIRSSKFYKCKQLLAFEFLFFKKLLLLFRDLFILLVFRLPILIVFLLLTLITLIVAEMGRFSLKKKVEKLSLKPRDVQLDGVSIVIPTWNKAEMIFNNLLETDRVLQLDENIAKNVEIIVINNGSPDNTAEKLETIKPLIKTKFTLVNLKENLGFARGINLGASLARYNYLYFFNDDMIPKTGFMKKIISYANHLLKNKIHFFGICSQIFFFDPTKRREESGKTYIRSHLGGFLKVAHCVEPALLESPSLTAYPGGGSSLINKSVFLQLGGYDHGSYRPMYAEDLDLGLMAWKKGLPSFYCPSSQIIHHHRASSRKSNIDPSVWMFTNWLVVRLKLCDGLELFKTIVAFSFLSLFSSRHTKYAKTVLRVLPAILASKMRLDMFKTIYGDSELLDFITFENNKRKSYSAAYEEK